MSWKWFSPDFHMTSLSLTARYCKSLCYALLLATVWQKLRETMSRTVAIVCIVSINYPRVIAVYGGNLMYARTQTLPPLLMKGLVRE